MVLSPSDLRVELRRAGIANAAVDAVWPQWWSSEAEASLSATAELTFTVARRLGLAPQALLGGEARFMWRDETKYKNLKAQATEEEAALSSFGSAVARVLVQGVAPSRARRYSALELRGSILETSATVSAENLLISAWALGVPVVQLQLFPLQRKRMHAMSVGSRRRASILLARDESYLAPMAFTLAHELGHVMLGHLDGGALVDFEAPLRGPSGDDEESQADAYALELLTGQPRPEVGSDQENFSATQLAQVVQARGPELGIDPGVLAMCAGHSTQKWDRAYGALKIIPPGAQDVAKGVNQLAAREIDWPALSLDGQEYLRTVMGLDRQDV
jgi:hypothetical protein